MVAHWRRHDRRLVAMMLNAAGACATPATVAVIIAAKFLEGAWLQRVHRRTDAQLTPVEPLDASHVEPPVAIGPINSADRAAMKAIRFALSIAATVYAVYVAADRDSAATDRIEQAWRTLVAEAAQRSGVTPPQLRVVGSPYRRTIAPLIRVIVEVARAHGHRPVAVVIPERIEPRWYQMWVHGQGRRC